MRSFLSKYGKLIAILLSVCVGLMLIITAVSMLTKYENEVTEESTSKAQYYTLETRNSVEQELNSYVSKAEYVAYSVSRLYNMDDIKDYLDGLSVDPMYLDIFAVRYYKGDTLYASSGEEFEYNDSSKAYRANTPDKAGYTGIYEDVSLQTVDNQSTMQAIGFYAPVLESSFVDAVVIYYPRIEVEKLLKTQTEEAEYTLLCTSSGSVLVGRDVVDNADISTVIRAEVGEKQPIDAIRRILSEGKDGSVSIKINAEDYIVSIGCNKDTMKDLAVVELYKVSKLFSSSLEFVHTVISIIVIFAVIVLATIVYYIVHSYHMQQQLLNLETVDRKLNCLNRHGFELEAKSLLERNVSSYFAVIVFQLRHFKFLLDNYGESEINRVLSHLRLTCSKTIKLEEAYGHIEDGTFTFLLHAKDRHALLERLKIHSFLATQYKGSHTFDVLLKYGIYEAQKGENSTVAQMIDFASEANRAIVKATAENAGMKFNFYNDELRKIRLANEDMELRMEGALQNGDFQVFYQPKYSLKNKKQDGCEALVRWYDSKAGVYNRPALFMQLFESNGFIVKLDKYVYSKVCEYISYSIAHGRTVYPVSVNVSRITAVQPDFIDYYTKVKKKHGIADRLIMIEFTESFAYENYDTLESIVAALHKNGFRCSIDDFGCGYSSYRILKSLPMDEIKLDKFFIDKGIDEKRDYSIFESIIALAKELGMIVTQEGVETKEDFEKLKTLGCDVIQGYYYSHPLPLTDYISFTANSKDHNLD